MANLEDFLSASLTLRIKSRIRIEVSGMFRSRRSFSIFRFRLRTCLTKERRKYASQTFQFGASVLRVFCVA